MMILLFLFACGEAEFLYECECTRRGAAKSIEDGGADEILDELYVQKVCETELNFDQAFSEGGSMYQALNECEINYGEEYNNVKCECDCQYVGACE